MGGSSSEGTTVEVETRSEPGARVQEQPGAAAAPAATAAAATLEAETTRLEELLAARARELLAARGELERLQGLLRDALARLAGSAAGPAAAAELAELARQRELAVSRALEAEAARAEGALRLDELMGHLVAAGASDGAEAGESLPLTCARLAGTVRGLLSSRAEIEEGRDLAQARLVLVEHDLQAAGEQAHGLERALAETREQVELAGVARRVLAVQVDALAGERAGLRARLQEAERAQAAAQAAAAEARGTLAQSRAERAALEAGAGAEREQLAQRIHELDQAITRENEKTKEVADELARNAAEHLLRERELERVREELSTAQARGEQVEQGSLVLERDAAAQQQRAEALAAALAELRRTLEQLGASLEPARAGLQAAAPRFEEDAATPAETTQPGMPTYIEAIEGLEEQVSLRDQRIVELSGQLARDRGRLSALQTALRALQGAASEGPLAEQLESLLALCERGDSLRP